MNSCQARVFINGLDGKLLTTFASYSFSRLIKKATIYLSLTLAIKREAPSLTRFLSQIEMNITSKANITSTIDFGSEKIVRSMTEGIAWCTAFILATLLVVLGNLLTIVLFAANKSLRRKSLYLVINMAFADLMLGTLSMPGYVFFIGGNNFQLWTGRMSSSLDYAHDIVDSVFMHASLISVAAISCERFCVIASPYGYRRTVSMKTYYAIISMSWMLTFLVTGFEIALDRLISPVYGSYVWISFGLIVTFVICGCNIRIWRTFQNGELTLQAQNREARNRRLTKTLLFVTVLALLAWIPLIVMDASQVVFGVEIPAGNFYYTVTLLNYSNSFLNPVVYGLRIPEFRQVLFGISCFKRRPSLKNAKRKHNFTLTSGTRLRTLRTNYSHRRTSSEVKTTRETSL